MPSQPLDATFAALADPTRRAILARLAEGEATVTELSRPFALSQPTISKHLKVLEAAGLITRSREAQRRPRRLRADRLQEAATWIGGYRKFWEESFGRLDEHLREMQRSAASRTPGSAEPGPSPTEHRGSRARPRDPLPRTGRDQGERS